MRQIGPFQFCDSCDEGTGFAPAYGDHLPTAGDPTKDEIVSEKEATEKAIAKAMMLPEELVEAQEHTSAAETQRRQEALADQWEKEAESP